MTVHEQTNQNLQSSTRLSDQEVNSLVWYHDVSLSLYDNKLKHSSAGQYTEIKHINININAKIKLPDMPNSNTLAYPSSGHRHRGIKTSYPPYNEKGPLLKAPFQINDDQD
jgi:hypothetical protein